MKSEKILAPGIRNQAPGTDNILRDFEIPSEASECAKDVRRVLARLVDAGAISLGELQTARDIIRRCGVCDARAYLLVCAMFVALHGGNAALALTGDDAADASILISAGRMERSTDAPSGEAEAFARRVALLWPGVAQCAASLGPFVVIVPDGAGGTSRRLYFRRYYNATVDVREQLSAAAAADAPQSAQGVVAGSLAPFLSYSLRNFVLSREQERAVEAAVANRLTVITGGPGTGKTTIVCSILRALIRREHLVAAEIALSAPTGRAAQRMAETLEKQADAADGNELPESERAILKSLSHSTIHTLLGGLAPHWRHNADNPLPHRLIVIDESSMIDLVLMRALLAAIRPDCRLVMLGDADQLPPVEAGAVLGNIIAGSWLPEKAYSRTIVRLSEARRFTGSLRTCADALRTGDVLATIKHSLRLDGAVAATLADPETLNSCIWRQPCDPPREIDAFLCEWADAAGLGKDGALHTLAESIAPDNAAFSGKMTPEARALFDALESSRILTVVKNGPFGAYHANETLLRHRLGRIPASRPLAAPGIPVIVTVNTPSLELYNGDIGVTVRGKGGLFAMFARGEAVVACPVARLPENDVAYAITVHKSQGSEFGNVLVVLPDTPDHPLLTRRMVYTAITRAKLRSVIFSSRAAILASAARK